MTFFPALALVSAADLVHPGITLGTPILAGLFGLLAIYLKHRLDRQDAAQATAIKEAAKAAVSAALAADRSAPTGNGYAGRTERALEHLVDAVGEIKRDVGGLRADHRHLAQRVDRHIDRSHS
ncbi:MULTISPECIES: hypothetical protein [unclassified Aeromicrobium]|uniref:hypothetical protein n=1 Tax=unclassified Aeromicrobium TaxID=2633570 RepID=UPI0028890633|nr:MULTISPECIES: hypothetical protein [unclassified Aeromicrobium]